MPKKQRLISIIFLTGAALLTAGWFVLQHRTVPDEEHYTVPKTLRYQFEITNTSGEMVQAAVLQAISPLPKTPTQKLQSIDVNYPYQTQQDSLGNQFLLVELPAIAPRAKTTVTVTAELLMAAQPRREKLDDAAGYLQEEPYIEFSQSPIKEIAAQFVQREDKPRAIHEWLVSNIDYSGYTSKPYGAQYALQHKKGDCTEFAYALASLSRANDIPARVLAGFVVEKPRAIVRASDYHNWAEVYQAKSWILGDSQKNTFAQDYQNYVAFRLLGEDNNESIFLPQHRRFSVPDKRISVRMI